MKRPTRAKIWNIQKFNPVCLTESLFVPESVYRNMFLFLD